MVAFISLADCLHVLHPWQCTSALVLDGGTGMMSELCLGSARMYVLYVLCSLFNVDEDPQCKFAHCRLHLHLISFAVVCFLGKNSMAACQACEKGMRC